MSMYTTLSYHSLSQAKHICSDGEMALSVLEDVSCILCGPEPLSHCTAPYALSDLHRMLTSAETQLHTQRGSGGKYSLKCLFRGMHNTKLG